MTTEQEERMIKAQEATAQALSILATAFRESVDRPAIEESEDERRVAKLELRQREIQAQLTIDRHDEERADMAYNARARTVNEAQLNRTEADLMAQGLLDNECNPQPREVVQEQVAQERELQQKENELRLIKRQRNIDNLKRELGIE